MLRAGVGGVWWKVLLIPMEWNGREGRKEKGKLGAIRCIMNEREKERDSERIEWKGGNTID